MNRKSKYIWGNPGRLHGEMTYDQLINRHALRRRRRKLSRQKEQLKKKITKRIFVEWVWVYMLLVAAHKGEYGGSFSEKGQYIQSVKQSGILTAGRY